jgi:alkylation response protein AidB-like acyl-CoA dehydrogenase
MAIDLTAARLLTVPRGVERRRRCRAHHARGRDGQGAFATEAAQRIVDDAVQILGGRGVLAESVVDRLYRAVRALRIYEGTTEIQHLVVADRLLAEGGGRGRGRGSS